MKIFLKRHSTVIGFAVLAIVLFAMYWPLFSATPLWDDYQYIVPDDYIPNILSPWDFWDHDSGAYKAWSFGYSALWGIYALIGKHWEWYRAFTLALHFGTAVLLWSLFRRARFPFALMASALFVLHPIHVESIGWIIQFFGVLAMFLFTLSVTIFVRFLDARSKIARWAYALLAVFVYYLSLKSKSVAAGFALLFLVLFVGRYWESWKGRIHLNNWRQWMILIPFFLLAFYALHFTLKGVSASTVEVDTRSSFFDWDERMRYGSIPEVPRPDSEIVARSLVFVKNASFYVQKMVWPYPQMLIYPKDRIPNAFDVIVLFGFIFVAYLFVRRRHFWLGMAVIAAAYVPVSGIVYIPYYKFSYVADHWAYGMVPGFLILLLGIKERFVFRGMPWVMGALILILGIRTAIYINTFSDRTAYLKMNIEYNPTNTTLRTLLADTYALRNDYENAILALEDAKTIDPKNPTIDDNIRALQHVIQVKGQEVNQSSSPE